MRDDLVCRRVAEGQPVAADVLNERIEEMVTSEVLFQEALRLKLDQQPELRRNLRLLLAQRLLAEKVDEPVLSREIPDEELILRLQCCINFPLIVDIPLLPLKSFCGSIRNTILTSSL